jgi:hypothetical protein
MGHKQRKIFFFNVDKPAVMLEYEKVTPKVWLSKNFYFLQGGYSATTVIIHFYYYDGLQRLRFHPNEDAK